ncbi:hypothetical protein HY448_00905 [Candidatus Pacearchaeota archaeon]|nr:hypothetical protein [Candidatus Pacearchaeota archaeon]
MAKTKGNESTGIAESNLVNKLFQQVRGYNLVRGNPFVYGQSGLSSAVESYGGVVASQDYNTQRAEILAERRAEGEQLGVFGEPTATDYDISLQIARIIQSSKQQVKLGKLEEITKTLTGPAFTFSVPKELKDYTALDLIVKSSQGGKESKLSGPEQDALEVYGLLSKTYDRGAALKMTSSNSYADFNKVGEAISEKYKPKEPKAT